MHMHHKPFAKIQKILFLTVKIVAENFVDSGSKGGTLPSLKSHFTHLNDMGLNLKIFKIYRRRTQKCAYVLP